MQDETSIDFKALLGLLKKNIMPLLVCSLWGGIFGFAISWFILPIKYQAVATLVVNVGGQQNNTLTNDQISAAKQLVKTCAVLIVGDAVLQEIISSYGMADNVESLKKRISVQTPEQTQLLQVAMEDENPQSALNVLAKIVESAPNTLKQAVGVGTVWLSSEPRVVEKPVSPKIAVNTFLGSGAGFVFCLFVIMLRKKML